MEEQERRDRELAARLQMETEEEISLSTAPAKEANMYVPHPKFIFYFITKIDF